jgi:uncharacterized protein YyaL (SSP411 family)
VATGNRLAQETSPYLRQHADNPVDWYPWGPDAFARAEAEDKPLFVSIGYASCHWCHVMAHESFEDDATAADLARSFVAVKVDREERPDVDAVYMAAVLSLSGSGGWPMSVFCTPDGRPFYAGTYFPPEPRHGMPSFRQVLEALADAWATRREEVEHQASGLTETVAAEVRFVDRLRAGSAPDPGAGDDARPVGPPAFGPLVARVIQHLAAGFDAEWGGFGPAPKFPRPTLVELCLRHHRRTGDEHALTMATTTLDAMAAGGIYDHLVGGFCRYSTDRQWLVPHFEKMLTDQALLARAYLHAWQVTGRADYRQVLDETLEYVLTSLGAPGGGLYSSEDADAGGVEGGHATFTVAEVTTALADAGRPDLTSAVLDWYGITARGNWEGTNIPCRPVGARLQRPHDVAVARRILAETRARRPQPALDDKVLTEWNAMTAATLAEAATATGTVHWGERALAVAEFLFAELRRPGDGRWLRSWQGGRARHLALAADHAWLVECCTRLAELTGDPAWTARACTVADTLLAVFWDDAAGDGAGGGVFTTGDDAEPLIVRPKDWVDGALPAANSVAAASLARLAGLTGEPRYRAAAERVVELAAPVLARQPAALADLVAAVGAVDEGAEVVVVGERPDLLAEVRRRWLPTAVLAWGEPGAPALWEGREPGRAYVCRAFSCRTPATDPATLGAQLEELDGTARPSGTGRPGEG